MNNLNNKAKNTNDKMDTISNSKPNNTNHKVDINSHQKTNSSNQLDQESKSWLEEKLIPKLKVALNQEKSVSEYKVESSAPLLMSSIIFLNLKLTNSDQVKEHNLVIKRPVSNVSMREHFQSDLSFHNEILFYERCGKNSKHYPRCFYTLEEPPINSVIVVENISQHGYHLCPEKVNLDMKYVVAAMEEIGRFHARSYTLKHKSPEEFFQIVSNIRETRYEYREKNSFVPLMNNLMTRVIKRLRHQNYDKAFCDKAEIFFSQAFENVMRAAFRPKTRQLATLCHGDFTVNNVFFKESDTGMKAMLFDFALISYGSPAIDLSTFIYLSVSREDIRLNFGQIFDAYYDSLANCLKENGFADLSDFSKESFLRDYKENALFGYLIACFYLPVMHGVPLPDIEILISAEEEQVVTLFSDIGGEDFEQLFTDMLIDMKNSGCLHHIANT